ncbi:MAG: SurA N-terminal domain-containing protein [Rhizobiales bacterium]|nr:SurA N-terminal domain-containing protein [Hyphomicrobiales bacterium]
MPKTLTLFLPLSITRFIAAALICAFAWMAGGMPARAQVAVIVNGDPITVFDIEQRMRLERSGSTKPPTRDEIVNLLIDDKLKLHIAKRYNLEVTEKEVDTAFATIAQRMRATPQQFAQRLESSGIKAATLKARLKSDIAWGQMVRGKFGASLQIREKDVLAAADSRKASEKEASFDYSLRPVLLVLPRGSTEAAIEAKRREAEALRARFTNCEEGIPFVRALRDVAVRDAITRTSADLSVQLRAVIDNVETGRLTPPEVTPNGIEMFAVCGKKDSKAETPGQRKVREEMFSEQFDTHSKRFLKELRSAAMIEYRN